MEGDAGEHGSEARQESGSQRTVLGETIVKLLAEALRVVQELKGGEVGRDAVGGRALLLLLDVGLDGLLHLTLASLGFLVDNHLMLELADVGTLKRGRERVISMSSSEEGQ